MSNILLKISRFLFAVGHLYSDPLERRHAQGMMTLTWVGFLGSLLLAVGLMLGIISGGIAPEFSLQAILSAITALSFGLILVLLKRRRLRGARFLFVIVQLFVVALVIAGGIYKIYPLAVMIPLIAAATLLGRGGLVLTSVVLAILIALGEVLPPSASSVPNLIPQLGLGLALVTLALVTLFFYGFSGFTQRLIQNSRQEVKILRQMIAFTSHLKAETEESVYAEAISFVRSQLGYAFAQVFYIGSDGKLSRQLQVTLGVKSVTEQQSNVSLSDGSIIEESARTQQLITTSTTDAPMRHSHFVPSSQHGAALPIVYDGTLLGVMDIQSDSAEAFNENNLNVLQVLGEQIGAAATHVRLVQALRENVRQQEELVITLRARLQEMRRAQGIDSSASWQAYVEQRGQYVFGFDLVGTPGTFIAAQDLPAALRPVIESGARQIVTQGDLKIVNIPINLRGEILGAMSFSLPKERVLTERQLETAELVANRLALALENKRLFEQTQAQALRERRANEATNLLITATNVESVMNVAAATFNEALGAIATRIHLQPNALKDLKPTKDRPKDKQDFTKEAVAS